MAFAFPATEKEGTVMARLAAGIDTKSRRRTWGWAVGLWIFTFLIGLTRIYLHVHYPTDVVAGFAAGIAWLVLLQAGIQVFWITGTKPGDD